MEERRGKISVLVAGGGLATAALALGLLLGIQIRPTIPDAAPRSGKEESLQSQLFDRLDVLSNDLSWIKARLGQADAAAKQPETLRESNTSDDRLARIEALVGEIMVAIKGGIVGGVKAISADLRKPKDTASVEAAIAELRVDSPTLGERTFCLLPWQVYEEFGRPDSVTYEGSRTVWRYYLIDGNGNPIGALRLTFADGVVVNASGET